MKEVQFYLAEDWRGPRSKKIIEIKNKELFMEYIKINDFCFGDSKVSEWFYEDEIEVIRWELKREKEKLSELPELKKHRKISAHDFNIFKNFAEERISKLEQLLKKYGVENG